MKRLACLTALIGLFGMGTSSAWALGHGQANRIHIYNPGPCAQPTGPLWVTFGTGRPAPGFVNVTAPGFDEIGALLTGNMPGETDAVLQAQTPACGVIASFYENATPVGAWVVPLDKLPQLISILNRNG